MKININLKNRIMKLYCDKLKYKINGIEREIRSKNFVN
jgi:hypothetical protein